MFRVITLLTSLLFLSFQVTAAPIKPEAPDQLLSPSLLLQDNTIFSRDSRLNEITKLMAAGQQQEANLRIARLLLKNPRDKDALELAGIALMQKHDFKAAEESFRRLIALPPVKPSVVTKYGVTKILNGDTQGGVKLLRQVINYVPHDNLANRYLGWVAENAGDFKSATNYLISLPTVQRAGLQEYHVALARNYKNIRAYDQIINLFQPIFPNSRIENKRLTRSAAFYLTLAYKGAGYNKKSSDLYKSLKPLIVDDPANLFGLDMGLAQISKDVKKGRQALDQLITSFPGAEAAGRFEMAKLYVQADDIPNATEEFDAIVEMVGEDEISGLLKTMIPLFIQQNMTSYAIGTMQELIKKYPENAEFKFGLAELQTIAEMNQEAAKTVKQLTTQENAYAPAFPLGAKLARAAGKPDLEEHYLKGYVQIQPKDFGGWISLARFYISHQKVDNASESLQKGLQANPNEPRLYYELASLYQAEGKITLANEQYRKALALNPNFLEAMDNLASNLLDANQNTDEAYKYAVLLYQALPKDPYIQDLMGWAHYRKQDLKAAEKVLSQAADAMPESGRADFHLALTLRQLGQTKKATRHFTRALEKGLPEPSQSEVKKALAQ